MSFINNFKINRIDKKIDLKIDELTRLENEFMEYFKNNPQFKRDLIHLQRLYRNHMIVEKKLNLISNRFDENYMRDDILTMNEFFKLFKSEKLDTNNNQPQALKTFISKYNKNSSIEQKVDNNPQKERSVHDQMADFLNSKHRNVSRYLLKYLELLRQRDDLYILINDKHKELSTHIDTAGKLRDDAIKLEYEINKLIGKRNKLSEYKFISEQPIHCNIVDTAEYNALNYYNNAEKEVEEKASLSINGTSLLYFELDLNSELPSVHISQR